jgi:hypothetical protein
VTQETYANGVRKTTFRDPDGNEIGFGGAPLSPASDPGDTTERDRLLAPFAALIGTWTTGRSRERRATGRTIWG